MTALRLRGFLRSLHGSYAKLLREISAAGQKVKRTSDKMAKYPSTATPCRYVSCPATLPDCPLLTPYSLPPPLSQSSPKAAKLVHATRIPGTSVSRQFVSREREGLSFQHTPRLASPKPSNGSLPRGDAVGWAEGGPSWKGPSWTRLSPLESQRRARKSFTDCPPTYRILLFPRVGGDSEAAKEPLLMSDSFERMGVPHGIRSFFRMRFCSAGRGEAGP